MTFVICRICLHAFSSVLLRWRLLLRHHHLHPHKINEGALEALMLCGFDQQAAEALQRHSMNSIDNMSVMDTANFTSMVTQVTRFRDPTYVGSPVLPIPAMYSLKGLCMWAAYHKARDSVVTMHTFTPAAHNAFLARYLGMKSEDGKDYSLMKDKLIRSFPELFTSGAFILAEKNLRSYL
jgi:hypothetical protein